ncbi:MAG TPA: dihydrodipicolinate synthase family protein [Vicinamibacterales bacterium]|jgi:4-hydroxy-tetrahydrodipicolinate synthase
MSLVSGVLAALPTPARSDGSLDLSIFGRLVDFVMDNGVEGICVGGATGEYPHFETADRIAVIRRASEALSGKGSLVVGIGAPTMPRVVELGRAAHEAGARAVLLPMPMFFRYEQDDLRAYCSQVSRSLGAPCLLYDLPEFTNGLSSETVLALLRDEPFIVGIKDSSGRAANLAAFESAPGRPEWTLIVGDDRLLRQGVAVGWNGGISGVAACYPELIVALVRAERDGRAEDAARLQSRLDEIIAHLTPLPTPWGIRVALSARGIDTGPLPLPLTAERRRQIEAVKAVFSNL